MRLQIRGIAYVRVVTPWGVTSILEPGDHEVSDELGREFIKTAPSHVTCMDATVEVLQSQQRLPPELMPVPQVPAPAPAPTQVAPAPAPASGSVVLEADEDGGGPLPLNGDLPPYDSSPTLTLAGLVEVPPTPQDPPGVTGPPAPEIPTGGVPSPDTVGILADAMRRIQADTSFSENDFRQAGDPTRGALKRAGVTQPFSEEDRAAAWAVLQTEGSGA